MPVNNGSEGEAAAGASKRRYDNRKHRAKTANTRLRILSAGAELARESDAWAWPKLTFKAVAQRAGIAERTVYRYFPSESDLHGAVMSYLTEQVGVDYSAVTMDSLAATVAHIFETIGSFAAAKDGLPRSTAAVRASGAERRQALLRAVKIDFSDEPANEQTALAATLDILWHPSSHALLTESWGMTSQQATRTITWAIDMFRFAAVVHQAHRRLT